MRGGRLWRARAGRSGSEVPAPTYPVNAHRPCPERTHGGDVGQKASCSPSGAMANQIAAQALGPPANECAARRGAVLVVLHVEACRHQPVIGRVRVCFRDLHEVGARYVPVSHCAVDH